MGKGFDGASTMSGHVSGVQARISEKFPRAKYFTHCSSHCLNLVVVHCCKVPMIRNFMDSFQRLSFFIRGSAKRKNVFADCFIDSGTLLLSQRMLNVSTMLYVLGTEDKFCLHCVKHDGFRELMP